ncbi:EamA family transporter [Xenorhabdus nematophila]|nr:EamA family transporter [Xenorhabdus nematophila]
MFTISVFFYGLKYIDASRASLIVAINPVVIAIFSYFFL